MKVLSLKLDEDIFTEVEELTAKLNMARNRYINEALDLYNKFNKRNLLKARFKKDAALAKKGSMEVLHEFEALIDEID